MRNSCDRCTSMPTQRPTLEARMWLLVLSIGDLCGLCALLLQLTTPGGMPLDAVQITERLIDPSLRVSFWWPPIAAALVFPAVGCIAGVFCLSSWALWAWSGFSVVAAAARTALCFEVRRQESDEELNRELLKDMLILSFFAFLSLSCCQNAASCALDLESRRTSMLLRSVDRTPSRHSTRPHQQTQLEMQSTERMDRADRL